MCLSYVFCCSACCLLSCAYQADLTDPTSLPATLVGISAIIDCATARPEESTQKVDWEGKQALIQCAQVCFGVCFRGGDKAVCLYLGE